MKKVLVKTIVLLGLVIATGCYFTACKTTPQNTQLQVYKTLHSVHIAVDTALDSYFSLVVKGRLSTNDLPRVCRAYNAFQDIFLTAVIVAEQNLNAPPPDSVVNSATVVLNEIRNAKEKGSK